MYQLVFFHDEEEKKKKEGKVKGRVYTKDARPKSNLFEKAKAKNNGFGINGAIEVEYAGQLTYIANNLGRLAREYQEGNEDSALEIIAKMQHYSEKISDWADNVSSKLVFNLNKNSIQNWKKHTGTMSEKMRRELLSAPVDKQLQKYQNDQIDLIKSLPKEAAERIHKLVYGNLYSGESRAKALADEIMKTENVSQSKARLIARTEVARITTGLVTVRAKNAGLGWYVWNSTTDVRTRLSHKLMDKVVCRWDDSPNPERLFQGKSSDGEKVGKSYGNYNAGETFNCRCFCAPLIRIDDVSFPVQVHQNGKITKMNREKFAELVNDEVAYPQ